MLPDSSRFAYSIPRRQFSVISAGWMPDDDDDDRPDDVAQ